MIKFFLKKNFCDVWDNVFSLVVPNFILISLFTGSYFLTSLAASKIENHLAPFFIFALLFAFNMIFIFAFGKNAASISNFGSPTYKRYFSSIIKSIPCGFGYGLILSFLGLVALFAVPFYWRLFTLGGKIYGLLGASILAFFIFISLMALQWFIPLLNLQSENNFKKALKKCFIIYFDNPWFSFFIFIHNIVQFVCSLVLLFLVPSFTGVVLSNTNALRLRLYKYDWWDENPEIYNDRDKRYEVPWDELLAEDKEALGPRNLRSFIFPWS